MGRDHQLEVIDRAVSVARDGVFSCLALTGEPGIGKTLLLHEARRRGEAAGLLAAEGRSSEFEAAVPFGLAVDALDPIFAQEDRWLDGFGEERLTELSSVFPSVSRAAGGPATGLSVERYRSHQVVRAALEEIASERPLLLAFDDVHWADEASLELVAHLLRHRPEGPLLLAFAYRPHQAPRMLVEAVSSADREGALSVLELDPLTEEQTAELLAGGVDEAGLKALYRDSGGNPFYATELVRAGRSQTGQPLDGRPASAADEHVPAAVRAAIAQEVEQAPAEARRLLEAAAVAGEPFALELAAGIAGMDGGDALAAVDELCDRELVRPAERPGRFAFRHPVVRRAVYVSAGPGSRLAAHARAAELLAEAGAPVSARAYHVERSASVGDESAATLLAAAGQAAAARAPGMAARWFSAALGLQPPGASTEQRLGLLIPLAEALGATGQMEEARAALSDALALLPPSAAVLRSRVVGEIARLDHMVGAHGEARGLLVDALAGAGDDRSVATVALKLELAMDHWIGADWESMTVLAAQARDTAQALDERLLYATACAHHALGHYYLGVTEPGKASADRAACVIDALSDSEISARIEVLAALGHAEFGLERYADSARHIQRGLDICRATGQSSWFIMMMCLLCAAELPRGRLREAAQAADAAIESARFTHDQPLAWALALRTWVWILQGDLSAAIRTGQEAVAVAERLPETVFNYLPHVCLALAEIESGQPANGRDRILTYAGGTDLDAVEPSWRPRWYEVLALAELDLGDLAAAEGWAERAEAAAAPLELDSRSGEAHGASAAVCLARGDAQRAAELARDAGDRFARIGRRVEAARSATLEARALVALGSQEHAIGRLEGAHSELAACGAGRYCDEAASELRRLGRPVAYTGKRRAASGDLASLTEREWQVAELVGGGLRNREIAAILFVSHKTVEKRLGRIFEKLGVSSRSAVASVVERARFLDDGPEQARPS